MTKKLFIMALAAGAAFWGILFSGQQIKKDQPTSQELQPPPVLTRPDLVLEKVEFEVEPKGDGTELRRIRYTIFNNSAFPSQCCPTEEGKKAWKEKPSANWMFMLWLEGRDYPSGFYQQVGGGISTLLAAYEKQTFNASEIIPAGKKRQYKARADVLNWIEEKNETNNEKEAVWPLKFKQTPIKKR